MGVSPTPSPAAEAAARAVWSHYNLPAPTVCGPTQVGLNDHHLITTPQGQYVLRVYRAGWRTEEDIAYEVAVLNHLAARGVPACAPLPRRDGAFSSAFAGEQGPRTAVLFTCAPGAPPDPADPAALRTCGRVMALIHRHTDDFTCEHQRFALDLDHLLAQPRLTLRPYLRHRPEKATFLETAVDALRAGLEARVESLEWGFCHGDFHGGNARLDGDGTLRVFDFDCGGPGWRAYDLSVCRLYCREEARWETFREGYEEVRPLPAAAEAALPWFIVARQVWRMGVFAEAWPRLVGHAVDEAFFEEHVAILRERLRTYLPELGLG